MTKRRDALKDYLAPVTANELSPDLSSRPQVVPGPLQSMNQAMLRLSAEAEDMKKAIAEGTPIIEIDPDLLSDSIIQDRLDGFSGPQFESLVESIRENGQAIPILVRPHPEESGRYQIAYGHRRAAALRKLGRPIKAWVRDLTDEELIIAQGNENLERKDLSFIERALFAMQLEDRGLPRNVILATFGTNSKGVLSEMIALARRLPVELVRAVGSAPSAGRPRWNALADMLETGKVNWSTIIQQPEFRNLDTDLRFERLLQEAAIALRSARQGRAHTTETKAWVPTDSHARVRMKRAPQNLTLIFDQEIGEAFGDFLFDKLESLYEAFQKERVARKQEEG